MKRLKLLLAIITIVLLIQFIFIGLLGLVVYQSTPNSVLAHETFIGRIPGVLVMVRIADRAMNIFYRGAKPEEPLPRYSLKIDKDQYKEMLAALPTELSSPWYGNLFMTDDGKLTVDGVFTDEKGERYDVKVRVRGDIFNHWAYNKKSWRVIFPKDKLFHGMREVNFILPEDRGWITEPLNAYRAEKLDLLHAPMRFVQISINGNGPLLYTEVEHWTKEMLEKQARPGDVNMYKTGGGVSYFQQWDPVFEHLGYWGKYTKDVSGADTYDEIEQLLALSKKDAHKNPEYLKKLQTIFDVDRLVSWYALSMLAGSRHVSDFNFRIFFDVSRGKFEPLPWDISMYAPRTLLYPPGNAFLNEVFSIPSLRLAAYRKVWEYVQDEDQVQDDLQKTEELLRQIKRAAYRDDLKILSNRQVSAQLQEKKSLVLNNIDFLREELNRCEVLSVQHIPDESQRNLGVVLKLELTAHGIAPAKLSEIHLPESLVSFAENGSLQLWKDNGNGVFGNDDIYVYSSLREEPDSNGNRVLQTQSAESLLWLGDAKLDENGRVIAAPHTLHRYFLVASDLSSLKDDIYPFKLDIRNAVTGEKAQVIGDKFSDDRKFEHLFKSYVSREKFLDMYPFFEANGTDEVLLSGNHTIQNIVVVPSTVKLRILPGTHLRMGKDASILSYAPVSMIGSDDNLIIIDSETQGVSWGVFAVLNASEPSFVQWLNISGGSEENINGAFFSGMLNFYGSPVTLSDSIIHDAFADDGLNLKNIYVDVNRVRFENNAADGLDIDMALAGVVENSLFIGNGNDGVDMSYSPIIIRNVEVTGSGDKCISVGEQSAPLIYDTTLSGCNYGLAVKDDSHVKVERVLFEKNAIAIGAYIKKSFFAAPSVAVTDSVFRMNETNTQALSGAVITLDSAQ